MRELDQVEAQPLQHRIIQVISRVDLLKHFTRRLRAGDNSRHIPGHGVDQEKGEDRRAQQGDGGPPKAGE